MTTRSVQDHSAGHENFSRRNFLAGATAAAAGLLVVEPRQVAAAEANSKITLGLIGCGGRGNWIANLFQQHGGYQFVATADYFPDRAKAAAQRLGVAENRAFSGLSGYKRLLDARPDAIVIESPPYFHAEQAHGRRRCRLPRLLRQADRRRRARLPDDRRRGPQRDREESRRADRFPDPHQRVLPGGGAPRACRRHRQRGLRRGRLLRLAGLGRRLRSQQSGEQDPHLGARPRSFRRHITEQFIHALDVATWIIDAAPVKAYGACGKNGRDDAGTCNDHFNVIYSFPKDVLLSFTGTQFGTGYGDIGCRMFGSQGMVDTHYFGIAHIVGQKSYKGGKHGNLYTDGAVSNIAAFHAAIGKGDCANTTVPPSVRSNLTTILGRMAAYKKAEVTWDEMIKCGEKLEFSTAGLKS